MMDVARQEATISASAEELWAVLVDFGVARSDAMEPLT